MHQQHNIQVRSPRPQASGLKFGLLFTAALVFFGPKPADAAIIDVTGSTLGCFGSGCDTFVSPATASNVTFVGAAFDVDTDATGGVTNIVLGSFSRGRAVVPELWFTLQVTFTAPVGADGDGTFVATMVGTSESGPGNLNINFDNTWHLFNFTTATGTGSFEFAVLNDPGVTPNGNLSLIYGGIRNAQITPTTQPTDVTPLPEPASMMLFGTAALAVAWKRRRRQ